MKKVNVLTFTKEDEPKFWEWLGDAYVSSSDYSDGEHFSTSIRVNSGGVEFDVYEGDVLTQDADGIFRKFTKEEFERQHIKCEADA